MSSRFAAAGASAAAGRYVFFYGVDFTIFLKEDFVKVFSLRVHVHDNANELRLENVNELKSWVLRVKS